ncbi:holo-ACP synthase [Acidipila sp. EB88]|uniref:holo-ACP synthase n=1 Tax=Acidipila sp. EB88 TaxID=2305226 RepID=UPI000F5EB21C|nr:holo-ACP synthase [Acidipila sp. EB88]RRA50111.1 holo-[acyl-carrier-protein] synthase [Acidipila sp. EB88]
MIVGLGIDLAEVPRIRASMERYGERFLARIYTEAERRYCATKRYPEQNLAARFAAKEAAAKALGTGISRGVGWQDLEVQRTPGRPPQMVLHGRARVLADALGVARISLSVTHTDAYATAVVIFEGMAP